MALFGRQPKTAGEILWQGKPVDIRSERDAIDLGIALAPESRRDQGLCLNLPRRPQPQSADLRAPDATASLIRPRAEATRADRQIARPADQDARRATRWRSSLSGGNQQKIVIGKWLNHGAKLFIFDEPTVGVDVGTKAEIYSLFGALLKNGAGIILISSYLPEVYELADTLHVFRARPAGREPSATKAPATRTILTRGDRRLRPMTDNREADAEDIEPDARTVASRGRATRRRPHRSCSA